MGAKEGRRKTFQSTPPVKAATQPTMRNTQSGKISIHAAREGGDVSVICTHGTSRFQSTPPVKAATLVFAMLVFLRIIISIHAAREGGDQSCNL